MIIDYKLYSMPRVVISINQRPRDRASMPIPMLVAKNSTSKETDVFIVYILKACTVYIDAVAGNTEQI